MAILYLILSIALIILLTAKFHVNPFLVLLLVAITYGLVSGLSASVIIDSINDGFGSTLGKIGLIIVLGVMIGSFLENSGGAFSLAEKVLSIIGRSRVTQAMGIIGYIVSIPVFADSGFLLLSPLNKSLAKRAGMSLAAPAVALMLGLTTTHCMVPPTPGPIAAAGMLNADLGKVLLLGLLVSAFALVMSLVYVKLFVRKTYIDPNPEMSEEQIKDKMKGAPGAFKSALPIIVPIVLIVLKSMLGAFKMIDSPFGKFIGFIGEPVIALLIGFFLSLLLPPKLDRMMISTEGWVGKSLRDAAPILLITGAGGIFGKILQNSGIGNTLGEALSGVNLSLWLPFVMAAAIKTSQGSSTVALITTASIMAPLMIPMGFIGEWDKAFVVIAIGAGSAVVSHANDSGFWVFTQLSGMDVRTGYRLFTPGTFVLGVSACLLLFVMNLFR